MNTSLPADTDLISAGLVWMVLNAAAPMAAMFPTLLARRRLLFAIGVLLSALLSAVLAASGRVESGEALWLAGVLFGAGLLPASLILIVASVFKRASIFRPLIAIPIAVAFASVAPVLIAAHAEPGIADDKWANAPDHLRGPIADLVKARAENDFNISAVDGRFTRAPEPPDELGKLALWIFTQRCGVALQPGLRVAGAQAAIFSADATSVQIVPSPETNGQYICRATVVATISYHLEWMPEGRAGSERKWTEKAVLRLEGLYDPATKSVALTFAEPLSENPTIKP